MRMMMMMMVVVLVVAGLLPRLIPLLLMLPPLLLRDSIDVDVIAAAAVLVDIGLLVLLDIRLLVFPASGWVLLHIGLRLLVVLLHLPDSRLLVQLLEPQIARG